MIVIWLGVLMAMGALFLFGKSLLKRLIRFRLKGYRRVEVEPEMRLPERASFKQKVAILGSGIAGLSAALTLARRGMDLTLFESSPHIGGKLGSWKMDQGGAEIPVSHGFHAFFPCYYNLNRLLDSVGARKYFRSIGDYAIRGVEGSEVRFGKIETTPVLNLLALARAGVFKLFDAIRAPGRNLYGLFLEYDETETFSRYDTISFERFNQLAKVSPGLRLAFNTFARAFFADADKLSLAELVKSFHFYYLSQDGGLIYEVPDRDFEASILNPIRSELSGLGARIHLSSPVSRFEKTGSGFLVNGEAFDSVVLSTDVVGAKKIMDASAGFPAEVVSSFSKLVPGQRYAVLRIWSDLDLRKTIPDFVITDRVRVLDAVSAVHRIEQEAREWSEKNGGSVVELHCYAVPDDMTEAECRSALVSELQAFFPEVEGLRIRFEHFQIKRDFTAFHTGNYAARPRVETGVAGFYAAGDWVKLPFPAMLMEAACAAGLLAANGILRESGLRQTLVESVPLRGLMAGMPQPPGRRILHSQSLGGGQ